MLKEPAADSQYKNLQVRKRSVENTVLTLLEPISKVLEQHGDECELHKAHEVRRVVFPANQYCRFQVRKIPRSGATDTGNAVI
jgi:hypothetical protein